MKPDKDRQRLFVEGPSDGSVVNKLVLLRLGANLAHPKSHQIVEASAEEGGVDATLERFRAALAAQRPERLGLLVDRDNVDGKPDRWDQVRAVLHGAGLSPPASPPHEGVQIVAPWGRVGVWLMPDNVSAGDLETFIETLLPAERAAWEFTDEAVRRARTLGATYKEVHRMKARVHTWLSWQDPPGAPYGTAIEARILGVSSPAADAFVAWFGWLFGA